MTMKNQQNASGRNGKDLMTVGIFTAVNLVVSILIACTIGLIPIGYVSIPFVQGIVLGIPMVLYFSKIKKFGMILTTYIVNGIVLMLTGTGFGALIAGIILGLLSELILKSGKYQSVNRVVAAYTVMNVVACANFVTWINASKEFIEGYYASYGETYINTIAGYFKYWWIFPAIVLSAVIGGLLGGLFGKAVLRKHFVRSGLL